VIGFPGLRDMTPVPVVLDVDTGVDDACAVADPGGIRTRRLPVRIELAGTWTRGRTIVDRRAWSGDLAPDPHGPAPAVVDVALEVDGERYVRLWLESLG
jgi:inosine-uridine nucleoside N-ribohydrolase